MLTSVLAAVWALSAAAAWGAGDFAGGLVARRMGAFFAVLGSYTVGLLALTIVALARGEAFPPAQDVLWGAVAGLAGVMGLGFLLRGFAEGRMGIVAPVAAVLGTSIPVLFAAISEGLPGAGQLAGFALARVERLFCRNERALLRLRLDDGGQPIALVPVAAVLVASMRFHFLDVARTVRERGANETACCAALAKGEEMGWFEHGSTIIVFAPPGFALCEGLAPGSRLRMGQALMRMPSWPRHAPSA